MSKFSRFVSKPARLPINWLIPRHTVEATKQFRFKSDRYPLCPNCSLSRFELIDDGQPVVIEDQELPEEIVLRHATWACPSCQLQVKTNEPTIKSIQAWCVDNAPEIFSNSAIQSDFRADFASGNEDSRVARSIKLNMLGCYLALVVATMMALSFFYAAYQVLVFYMFNTLLFTLGAMFIAIVFNYRAWQAQTNIIYTSDAKQTFQWWVKTHPWYVKPRDIGLPPNTSEIITTKSEVVLSDDDAR